MFFKNKSTQQLNDELLKHQVKEVKAKAFGAELKASFFALIFIFAAGFASYKLHSPTEVAKEECLGICASKESSRLLDLGYHRGSASFKGNVFVIDYNSAFTIGSAERFAGFVESVLPMVSTGDMVVLSITSPGGAAISCPHSYAQVERLKTRGAYVVASVDYFAASCGYMLASSAHKVIASPGAMIGNIGAALPLRNEPPPGMDIRASTMAKKVLITGVAKTPEENAFVEAELQIMHNSFVGRVEKYRSKKVIDKVAAYSGRKFTSENALKIGLIDKVEDRRTLLLGLHLKGYNIHNMVINEESSFITRFIKQVFGAVKVEVNSANRPM